MLEKHKLCDFPIKFLNDNLTKIGTGDLILVACASGCGKSTLSRLIARKALESKCRTVLLSLENEPETVASEETLFAYIRRTGNFMELRDFVFDYTENKDKYTEDARQAYMYMHQKDPQGNPLLKVVEEVAKGQWSIKQIENIVRDYATKGYRLFILDHLDVLASDTNVKDTDDTMARLWAVVCETKIAMVTFSQLSKRVNVLAPGMGELRGSGNKVNKCTHLITVAKHDYGYYTPPSYAEDAQPTYVRIAKSRDKRLRASVCFFYKGHYMDEYIPVETNAQGDYVDGLTHEKLQKFKKQQNS